MILFRYAHITIEFIIYSLSYLRAPTRPTPALDCVVLQASNKENCIRSRITTLHFTLLLFIKLERTDLLYNFKMLYYYLRHLG